MPQKQYTDPYSNFISEDRKSLQNNSQPLSGIRVLELSSVVAAPFAAAMLGDAGAEVIKVENPSAPDALRGWGVSPESKGVEPYYFHIGRNKTPVTLNLKTPEGVAAFKDLIQNPMFLLKTFVKARLIAWALATKFCLGLIQVWLLEKSQATGWMAQWRQDQVLARWPSLLVALRRSTVLEKMAQPFRQYLLPT